MPLAENRNPREYLQTIGGKKKRADWAHQNTLEAIPAFSAAVIIAHNAQGEQFIIDAISVSYVTLRIAYGFLYIFDKHILRSIVWMGSMICIIGLFLSCT